jgi:molecular chaperone GrpE
MTERNDPQRPSGADEYAETQILGAEELRQDNGQNSGEASGKPGLGDEGGQAANDPAALRKALDEAEARAAHHHEQTLRVAAEMDNLRKRSAREIDNARKFGTERLAGELLGVLDSLEMGLQAARGEGVGGALLEGQEATLKLLRSVLEKFGVSPLEATDARFDPEFHEAMTMIPMPGVAPGTVIEVIQKGYLLHGRLLRPARVIVAAEPPPAVN